MHASHYSRLEKPTINIPLATQERLRNTYILLVVPITANTHDRRESIGKKKQRKEKKTKERKEKTRKRTNRKGKKRKERQEKEEETRQEEGARKGKEKKMSY